MPTTQSKEATKSPSYQPENVLGLGMMLHFAMVLLQSTTGATVFSIQELSNNDPNAPGRWLPFISSAGAFLNFFANPLVGNISDLIGRKPIIVLSYLASALCTYYQSVATNINAFVGSRILAFLCMNARVTMTTATYSDMYKGKELAQATSKYMGWMGRGYMLGPFLVLTIFRNVTWRTATLLGAIMDASIGLYSWYYIKETNDAKKRKVDAEIRKKQGLPLKRILSFPNPLSFLKLFETKDLTLLTLGNGLQEMADMRSIGSLGLIYQLQEVQLTAITKSIYLIGYGLSMVIGRFYTKRFLPILGAFKFTAFGNICSALAHFCRLMATPSTQGWYYLSSLPGIVGEQRHVSIKAIQTQKALRTGFTRGELAGAQQSFSAIIGITWPLICGYVYRYNPRSLFVIAGLATLLSQIPYQIVDDLSLSKEESLRSTSKPDEKIDTKEKSKAELKEEERIQTYLNEYETILNTKSVDTKVAKLSKLLLSTTKQRFHFKKSSIQQLRKDINAEMGAINKSPKRVKFKEMRKNSFDKNE